MARLPFDAQRLQKRYVMKRLLVFAVVAGASAVIAYRWVVADWRQEIEGGS